MNRDRPNQGSEGRVVNVTVERTGPDQALVAVEVEAERVDRAVADALRHLSQRYVIPGFRRGKAPRRIIESFLGKDAIYQEALSHLIDTTFDAAVEKEGLRPVGNADLEDDPNLVEGQPLAYRARVMIRPDITLDRVRDLEFETPHHEIDEAAVDSFLHDLRRQRADERDADTVGELSLVRAQVSTEVDGTVIEEPREGILDIEQGDPVITGLSEALVGTPVGETRQVVWTVPADHPEHAGKEALTRIEVLEVRDRVLPPLDEHLAKSAGAASVEDLRVKAREYLEAQMRNHIRQDRLEAAVNALSDSVEVSVPEPLVERQSDVLWEEFLVELKRQRIPLEAYVAASGRDESAVREGFRPQAERRAKRNLVLEALAEQEHLLPLEGEIRLAADRLLGRAEKGQKDGKRTLSRGQYAYVRDVLMREKALAFLTDIYAPEEEGKASEGEASEA